MIIKNPIETFHRLRWGETIACPRCGSIHIYHPGPGELHICADCDNRFSDTSNTIFHSTKLPLHKWLEAIYLFVSLSRGISSYNLARSIGVSQPTAWRMLKLIREHLDITFNETSIACVDEIYLGADWSKKPAKAKFKKVPPPKLVWNLKGKDLKDYYKGAMMAAASQDKIPILGICDYNSRKVRLQAFPHGLTSNSVKSHLCENYPLVTHYITDQSRLYNWMDDMGLHRSICDHYNRVYISKDGFSSNRIEGVFAHLKRMYRGTYQFISKKYVQLYLNEFAWRWNSWDSKPMERFQEVLCLMLSR